MDKETLIKHHFWMLLGLAVVLLPVASCGVWFGVADATASKAQEIDARETALKGAKPKGENYVKALADGKEMLEGEKTKVWKQVYDAQAGLIEWPQSLPQASALNKLYFGDPMEDSVRNAFRHVDVYRPAFEELAELVKPTELAGGWDKVMRHVVWKRDPTKEEVWLALEDLCVQREMLRCVHDVNMLLARFTKVDNPEVEKELKELFKPAAGEAVYRFVSPYWQLDIGIVKAAQSGRAGQYDVRCILKNVSGRRLNIAAIELILTMVDPSQPSKPAVLRVEGGYLGHEETLPEQPKGGNAVFFKRTITSGAPKAAIYAIEQKLDSRYVPVKRIDKIALGYHAHRTSDKPLVMCTVSEEAKKKEAEMAQDPAASDPSGAPPPPAAAAGGAPSSGEVSKSGLVRQRYVTCNEQVRRMPIGVVLTIDQAHVQDVLRAFANSRLRFQTTQMHFTRSRGAPQTSAAPAPPPTAIPFGGDRGPVPGFPAAAMTTQPVEAANPNLVEMAIYGLASIYEKYPPKPKAVEAAAPAAPGATPDPAATPPAAPTAPPATNPTPPAAPGDAPATKSG